MGEKHLTINNIMRKTLCLSLTAIFLISSASALDITNKYNLEKNRIINTAVQNPDIGPIVMGMDDIDPLIDLEITVNIKKIRVLDKIDLLSDPDFYVKIFVNDVEYTSEIWRDQKYVEPSWSILQDVPDDEEEVNIKIQLWDSNFLKDRLCDISSLSGNDVELVYNLKTGHWTGDDYVGSDASGYGRLNGCDDNTIYVRDRDCELWFDISQNDYDGDGIPYWTEVNVYGTDPEVDDTGRDDDDDGLPIEWEHKWLYDPFEWNDHTDIDSDEDGLDNFEEYLTSEWGSDPFRRDIFFELDQMEIGPNGEGAFIPELSKVLLIDAFSKYNIVFHIDDSGEHIPFDASTTGKELRNIYFNYFLNGNSDNWKRGAFHYGLIIYRSSDHPGFVFGTTIDGVRMLDSFQVSTKYHETLPNRSPFLNSIRYRSFDKEYRRAVIYAGAMMHETGHTLGIFHSNTPGCDADSVFPWGKEWFKYRKYKSCMNYNYVYSLVDYSDGSHGSNDFDDWGRIDLTNFQRPWT